MSSMFTFNPGPAHDSMLADQLVGLRRQLAEAIRDGDSSHPLLEQTGVQRIGFYKAMQDTLGDPNHADLGSIVELAGAAGAAHKFESTSFCSLTDPDTNQLTTLDVADIANALERQQCDTSHFQHIFAHDPQSSKSATRAYDTDEQMLRDFESAVREDADYCTPCPRANTAIVSCDSQSEDYEDDFTGAIDSECVAQLAQDSLATDQALGELRQLNSENHTVALQQAMKTIAGHHSVAAHLDTGAVADCMQCSAADCIQSNSFTPSASTFHAANNVQHTKLMRTMLSGHAVSESDTGPHHATCANASDDATAALLENLLARHATPQVANVPDAPQVANVPDAPQVANVPDAPQVANVPDAPQVANVPSLMDRATTCPIAHSELMRVLLPGQINAHRACAAVQAVCNDGHTSDCCKECKGAGCKDENSTRCKRCKCASPLPSVHSPKCATPLQSAHSQNQLAAPPLSIRQRAALDEYRLALTGLGTHLLQIVENKRCIDEARAQASVPACSVQALPGVAHSVPMASGASAAPGVAHNVAPAAFGTSHMHSASECTSVVLSYIEVAIILRIFDMNRTNPTDIQRVPGWLFFQLMVLIQDITANKLPELYIRNLIDLCIVQTSQSTTKGTIINVANDAQLKQIAKDDQSKQLQIEDNRNTSNTTSTDLQSHDLHPNLNIQLIAVLPGPRWIKEIEELDVVNRKVVVEIESTNAKVSYALMLLQQSACEMDVIDGQKKTDLNDMGKEFQMSFPATYILRKIAALLHKPPTAILDELSRNLTRKFMMLNMKAMHEADQTHLYTMCNALFQQIRDDVTNTQPGDVSYIVHGGRVDEVPTNSIWIRDDIFSGNLVKGTDDLDLLVYFTADKQESGRKTRRNKVTKRLDNATCDERTLKLAVQWIQNTQERIDNRTQGSFAVIRWMYVHVKMSEGRDNEACINFLKQFIAFGIPIECQDISADVYLEYGGWDLIIPDAHNVVGGGIYTIPIRQLIVYDGEMNTSPPFWMYLPFVKQQKHQDNAGAHPSYEFSQGCIMATFGCLSIWALVKNSTIRELSGAIKGNSFFRYAVKVADTMIAHTIDGDVMCASAIDRTLAQFSFVCPSTQECSRKSKAPCLADRHEAYLAQLLQIDQQIKARCGNVYFKRILDAKIATTFTVGGVVRSVWQYNRALIKNKTHKSDLPKITMPSMRWIPFTDGYKRQLTTAETFIQAKQKAQAQQVQKIEKLQKQIRKTTQDIAGCVHGTGATQAGAPGPIVGAPEQLPGAPEQLPGAPGPIAGEPEPDQIPGAPEQLPGAPGPIAGEPEQDQLPGAPGPIVNGPHNVDNTSHRVTALETKLMSLKSQLELQEQKLQTLIDDYNIDETDVSTDDGYVHNSQGEPDHAPVRDHALTWDQYRTVCNIVNKRYQQLMGSGNRGGDTTRIPLASIPCRYNTQGTCNKGDRCRFRHT